MDSKLIRLADAVEKANIKHPSFRWIRLIHDVSLWVVCLLVLITGCIYGYEKLRPIEQYINPIVIVSTKMEFEATEDIWWIPIVKVDPSLNNVVVNTILQCDDGDGYELISTSSQPYTYSSLPDDAVDDVLSATSGGNSAAFTSVSRWLRSFAEANDVIPLRYDGAIPTEISTCYGYHTFVAETPILGITKSVTVNSYPFDYVWYRSFVDDGR